MSIYTVGTESIYDERLAGPHSRGFSKVGRTTNYPGGFALRTPENAALLISRVVE